MRPKKAGIFRRFAKKSGSQKWGQIHLICNKQSCLRNFISRNLRRNIFVNYSVRYTLSLSLSLSKHRRKKTVLRRFFNMVPKRGLEPPRFYSLVPETSASTNSAIWACFVNSKQPRNLGIYRAFVNKYLVIRSLLLSISRVGVTICK